MIYQNFNINLCFKSWKITNLEIFSSFKKKGGGPQTLCVDYNKLKGGPHGFKMKILKVSNRFFNV